MPCLAALAMLLLLTLPILPFTLAVAETAASECGYTDNSTLLVLSCSPSQAGDIPARLSLTHGVRLSPIGTTVAIENATQLTLPPPPPSPLRTVQLKRCGLSGLRLLPQMAGVSQLLLNLSGLGLELGGQGEFHGIGGSLRVISLDLSNNQITQVPSGTFNDLPDLVALDLSGNGIDFIDNDTFCNLTSLRRLDISDNPMLMTFALIHLPALESLDTSMSVLEVGVFCRLSSLKRIVLDRPLKKLQCFVFDSLPQLRELSFLYMSGSTQICFTMMCDPHPVLNQRVPFNFTITSLHSDGSVAKVVTNFYIQKSIRDHRRHYYDICRKNHVEYLKHDAKDMPVTTGCLWLESQTPACQRATLPSFNNVCSVLSTNASPVSTVTTIVGDTTSSAATTSTERHEVRTMPIATKSVASTTVASSGTYDHSEPPTTARQNRLAELEAVILRQDRVLVAMYTVNGLLLLCLTVLFVRCMLSRYGTRGSGHWRRRSCASWAASKQEQPLTSLPAASETPLVDTEEVLVR